METEQYVTYKITESNVAVVSLDNKDARVNIFSTPFMEALEHTVQEISSRPDVKSVLIRSGKSAGFVAGANIDEIEAITDAEEAEEKSHRGQEVFQLIDELKVPTIAAINGHCMGGGTELTLACDFRLAAKESAKIALPEVKLGIFPAWGGSQRLPRLISLQTALDLILTGKTYNAYRAYKTGLVDKIVPDELIDSYPLEFAQEINNSGGKKYVKARKKKAGGFMNALLEKNPLGRAVIWSQAKKNIMKNTGGNYPAPLKALEVIKKGFSKSLEKGLEIEAREFGKLVTTQEHKNLLHVYHLNERPKKLTGVDGEPALKQIDQTAVLGAGVMGGGIAQLLAYKDYPVRMKDIDQQMVADGLKHAGSIFKKAVKKHKVSKLDKERKMELISGTVDYGGFGRADVVIEAVVEKMAVKQSVLQEVEPLLADDAIFASNTSALSISELQSVAEKPERVCGMHFFNPVHKMPLIEVVRGDQTDDKTVATIFDLSKNLSKTPIVVQDSPGFLVNRLLGVYLNEACFLAEEGYDIEWLDMIVKKFGMPMGPFRLIDEVGIDIAADVAETLGEAFGEYLESSTLLQKVHESGLLGKKAGKGFYKYKDGHSDGMNSDVRRFASGDNKGDNTEPLQRMMYLMVNEAARCLEENVVASPEDIDTGMIFGTGFPPFRGGLCRYADAEDLSKVFGKLTEYSDKYGQRFAPADYLETNSAFYG
ncbi:MAG: enoyl-CoA hydratase/isomerase family protein [Candidatus Marinimicrobia bacterium]|nr:enoyl-CoA hydratase/isomerase family protein [Candidatus Neomarinimicrobiota bacterium]MCF7827840.1 enoyl-CoA hydratase/isomerase family protein [Candidatus Neomarinimicrobiota bacterium]MCF7879405.1 enoyl-CoA hydratase/isomerase family protein [Candidatus Neomarinimicrobiota bacterium]